MINGKIRPKIPAFVPFHKVLSFRMARNSDLRAGVTALEEQNDKQALQKVIDGFLAGNSAEYETIKARIGRYIHSQRLADGVDKEDVLSEILGALFQNLKNRRFRGDSLKAFEVYIYSMVKNKLLSHLKTEQRYEYPSDIRDLAHLSGGYIVREVADRDLSTKILAAIDEKCRQLLEYKFRRGWSDQELADHMGKTRNAISTAVSRCIKKAQELDIVKENL